MSPQQSVAFFGATGGCTLSALVSSLNAGYQCRALARTPQKLLDSLSAAGVSNKTLQNLQIVNGNVVDIEAVTKTLQVKDGTLVSKIIFGIGAAPSFKKGSIWPEMDQPTICEDASATIFRAIQFLPYVERPKICVISTTGLDRARDVPVVLVPLYHWLLKVPHEDKRKMEDSVVRASKEGIVSSFAIVRPSLLTAGESKEKKVRAGVQEFGTKGELVAKPTKAVGYIISRKDVGIWIFKNLVDGGSNAWGAQGKKIVLSY